MSVVSCWLEWQWGASDTVFGVGESVADHTDVRIESVQLCLSFHIVFLSAGIEGDAVGATVPWLVTQIRGFLDAP